jgi:hypothetical protein
MSAYDPKGLEPPLARRRLILAALIPEHRNPKDPT